MMLIHEFPQPIQPRRVVILGATGVIGRALTLYLEERGIAVSARCSRELNLVEKNAGEQLAGLLHPDDALVMLAGLPPRVGRDLKTMMLNIDMAVHVCAAVARQPVAHLVYMSSDAVYPRHLDEITEDSPTEPSDPYSAMHLVREQLLGSLGHAPVAILRGTQICALHDTHDAYGPNRFRRTAMHENRIVLFGRGEETRDHIMVEDVAAVIHRCLVHRSRGIVNVATGQSLSFAEVARLVAEQFDPPPALHYSPRQIPITHRRFDVSTLTRAFPGIACSTLQTGVARIMQQTVATGQG
jgi:UDP-glucose 4-epimerase